MVVLETRSIRVSVCRHVLLTNLNAMSHEETSPSRYIDKRFVRDHSDNSDHSKAIAVSVVTSCG